MEPSMNDSLSERWDELENPLLLPDTFTDINWDRMDIPLPGEFVFKGGGPLSPSNYLDLHMPDDFLGPDFFSANSDGCGIKPTPAETLNAKVPEQYIEFPRPPKQNETCSYPGSGIPQGGATFDQQLIPTGNRNVTTGSANTETTSPQPFLSQNENEAGNLQSLNTQQCKTVVEKDISPKHLRFVGHTLPPLFPYKCEKCFHEGSQANQYSLYGGKEVEGHGSSLDEMAIHNDYSGIVSNGKPRYPDPEPMEKGPVSPYGLAEDAPRWVKAYHRQRTQASNPLGIANPSATAARSRENMVSNYRRQPGFDQVREKVSHKRGEKKQRLSSTKPDHVYRDEIDTPEPWGPRDNLELFQYTEDGRLIHSLRFSASQIQYFIHSNPRDLILWVQHYPSQCTHRFPNGSSNCIWERCPEPAGKLRSGWLQVSFDEYPELTSNGARDPFRAAGAMHLYCFEQCFDVVPFYKIGMLRPENRAFPREEKNPMHLERDPSNSGLIQEAFHGWFNQSIHAPPCIAPRPHESSLSCSLVKYHLGRQIGSRGEARDRRNQGKDPNQHRTINVHLGDLKLAMQRRITRHVPPYARQDFVPEEQNAFQLDAEGVRYLSQTYEYETNPDEDRQLLGPVRDWKEQYASKSSTPEPPSAPPHGTKRGRDSEEGDSPKRRRTRASPEPSRRSPRLSGNQPADAMRPSPVGIALPGFPNPTRSN